MLCFAFIEVKVQSPDVLPSISFLSLETYIINYSDGRRKRRKKAKNEERKEKDKDIKIPSC